MGRCRLAAVAAGMAAWGAVLGLHWLAGSVGATHLWFTARRLDGAELIAGSLLWTLVAVFVLEKTGSALPRVSMKRLGLR
jgi:hypothetical protein